ncbi:protein OSB1, mitochondrial isoform X2 [Eutrema salsugineum]|uniref:protein OSB1, mitochondrial isoform X2 n=1 Tax=Eutrema salsugineum TaxID=72664 RepID=UPI000CED0119|nr:protein OSB1, mitochondrial isoform X2 [Eutrema salsugineum]
MNTFRLGTLIRRTASQISSNQFLRFSGSFASISKSRFFSNEADGESAVYHHARLFRKPLSIGFTSNLSNSVSLMGFVNRPIRVIDTVEPDRFGVSTLLRVKDPRDQNRSFSMWDAMARKCIAHLKPNDFIHVSGRLVSFGNENSSLGLKYQVKVTEVNYVMAPPSHVLVSQTPQKPKSETVAREYGIEESKNGKIHLWEAFFANPDEWSDNRRNKKNPKQPDFMRKGTREALWLDSDIPVWITRQLELFDQRRPDGIEESKNDEIHLWNAFFANPDEWWDKRRNKKNPKQPDFKHKDTNEAFWLGSDTPVWVTRQLELFDQKRPDGIEESKNDKIHMWEAFFANPDEWWDKRRNKKNPKQPDFTNKDTDEALWLGSDTPVWVIRQLELFDQGRADGIEESNSAEIYLWQVFFANPQEWWDNRRDKLNPRWPDFKHKDTGEALWLHSDTPVWVSRQLELLDQRNANKSCYDQKQTRRGNLADWL